MDDCSGPLGSLRICHERLYEHGTSRWGVESDEHFCDLPASHFCWDDCKFYCASHTVARHDRHRVEVIE